MKAHITRRRLTAFLYELMRDELPPGVVARIVKSVSNEHTEEAALTNGYLGEYAEEIAEMLVPAGQIERAGS